MTLRLVLVSLVAALGLTIPGAPMIESWVASTQNWMNARFADWDTRDRQTKDYVIVSDYYDADGLALRPQTPPPHRTTEAKPTAAGSPAAAPTLASSPRTGPGPGQVQTLIRPVSFQRKLMAFQPLDIDTPKRPSIVEELNRRNEGVLVAPAPITRKPAADPSWTPLFVADDAGIGTLLQLGLLVGEDLGMAPARPAPAARVGFTPLPVPGDLYAGLAYELNRQSEGIGIAAPVASARRVTTLASFGPMENSPSLYFEGDLKLAATTNAAVPEALVPAPRHQASVDGSGEDLSIEVAGELLAIDDGFAAAAPPRTALAVALKPRFALLEVPAEEPGDLAYELNRRNDGLSPSGSRDVKPIAPAATAPAPAPASELSRAVKLTREAVYAWVTVFTGPAIVTTSASD
jgi:hypothetical protein